MHKAAGALFIITGMKKYLLTAAALFSLAVLLGCATGNSGKTKVVTAYMPSGNLKYYIRPGKMVREKTASDKAHVLIDFTYQMEKRVFVSDAYANFTLYADTEAFIEGARFVLPAGKTVELSQLSTLDRDVRSGYVRVSTVLEKGEIREVLDSLKTLEGVLEITLDDGSVKRFAATNDLSVRIDEAFSK